MTGEAFLRIFGEIDEEYIQQANEDINLWEKSREGIIVYANNSRRSVWKTVTVSAACIAAAVFGIIVLVLNIGKIKSEPLDPITEESDCIISYSATWYEDGMFYEIINSANESILCYYSKTDDRSAVVCGNPECTHVSKTSPDCGALKDSEYTHARYGYNRVGDKLYYISMETLSDKSTGSLDLVECDVDGKNRKVIASIENTTLPFIRDVRYYEDHVLVSYFEIYEFVPDEVTGQLEMKHLEKYKYYMLWIDLSTGEIETLVTREEYSGYGGGLRYNDTVYYNYAYHIVPSTGEMYTEETAPELYGGFYVRDLTSGKETEYKNIVLMNLDHFSPETMICYDRENKKLCLFYPESGTFSNSIADYNLGGFTTDGKDALFAENTNSEYWTRYNFETGELTQIPCYDGELDFSLNSARTVGDTVWLDYSVADSNFLGHAYIDRDDFFSGKFENIKPIKEVGQQ